MKIWQKNGILVIALLTFGAARMPYEAGVAKDLAAAKLLPQKLEIGTRDKIGQTSSAVALGGLRTLVATFMNLRAFSFFEEKKWDEVASTYNMIVDLAPRTGYYWDAGFSHSAYNAASYYINDSTLPPLRRKQAWRASIIRGKNFLEKGIRNNPTNWNLWAQLGFLLSDSNKLGAFPDQNVAFTEAAMAYRKAKETGRALDYVQRSEFYALSRIVGGEKEALALGRHLYANPRNRTPTLNTLMFVLESWNAPDADGVKRAIEIFGTPEKAHDALSAHWQRTRERFPVYGVADTLQALEKQLEIAPDKSVLNQPLPSQHGPDDWFSR